MKVLLKLCIIFFCIIVGGIGGIRVWAYLERTVWQRLDYFPFPVQNLISMESFGKEFWVETTEGEIYKIIYPCLAGEKCWEKSSSAPSLPANDIYIEEDAYDKRDGACDDRYNKSPFPGKLKTCITIVEFAESLYMVSLGLDDRQELWIWDQPWESPYTVMAEMISAIFCGSMTGFILSLLLIQIPIKIPFEKVSEWFLPIL